MFYIVEIQKSAEGAVSHLVQTAPTRAEAESKYHGVLQYAAVSPLAAHSALVFSDEGFPVLHQCYKHAQAEEPEEVG